MKRSPWGKLSKSDSKKARQIAKSGLVKGNAKIIKIK